MNEDNAKSMLFNFQLDPVEEIVPWTNSKGDKSLGWYALSLGHYWIDAEGDEVFRYSDEIITHWARTYPQCESKPHYVHYQVARLWEDLIEILPDVLSPILSDLAAKIADFDGWRSWTESAYEHPLRSDINIDRLEGALSWWRTRTHNAGHLRHPPGLWLWTVDNMVHVRWDNRGISEDNIPIWQAHVGEISMPTGSFIEEIMQFDALLMSSMAERIIESCRNWTRDDVYINLDHLKNEQEERSTWLANALSRPRNLENWDRIRFAMSEVEQFLVTEGPS